jgi:uncharacterized protein YggU (UPF0235/DUF167 family)
MYIKVRVKTGSKKEIVKKVSEDHFEVSVREKAERNLANTRVREIIAEQVGLTVRKVKIIKGHHSPSKILSISTR